MYKSILDLYGNPFCFFRGEKSKNNIGSFFTNCYSEAKGFAGDGKLIKCHIRTKSPLIIDATRPVGYDTFNGIEIRDVKIFPESARTDLVKLAEFHSHTGLSTDDILEMIKKTTEFDCVIIKNIQEGLDDIPVYVVMVTNSENIYDIEEITNCNDNFSEWTTKRVRLSDFINSLEWDCNEKDGLLCIRHYKDFSVEDSIISVSDTEFKMVNKYIFLSEHKKVRIKSLLLNRYIKGVQEEKGQYKCDLVDGNAIFDTINGRVSISNIPILPPLRKEAVFIVENAEI